MKTILVLVSSLLLFGAILYYVFLGHPLEKDEKLVNTITSTTAKTLRKKQGLVLVGTSSKMIDDIEMLGMSFDYPKTVDINIARRLLIDSVEEYLSEINSNKQIKPYLHNFPFTDKNIEIVIGFHNPNSSEVRPDQISTASAREGHIIYYVDYPEKHTLKAVGEETYEEAKNKRFEK